MVEHFAPRQKNVPVVPVVPTGRRVIDIEALMVWTYREQRARQVVDRGVGLFEGEAAAAGIVRPRTTLDGSAKIAEIGMLGVRVDRSGAATGDLHPDAELVHDAVRRLVDPVRIMLLIQYAEAGARPDCHPTAVEQAVPVLDANGRAVRDRRDRRLAKSQRPELMRMAAVEQVIVGDSVEMREIVGGWELVAARRREYTDWWTGLICLAGKLRTEDRLTTWAPTGPTAPKAPWMLKSLDATPKS